MDAPSASGPATEYRRISLSAEPVATRRSAGSTSKDQTSPLQSHSHTLDSQGREPTEA